MYLIVGLGNPEEEYSKTRHNMGFNTINKISQQYNIEVKQNKFQALYGSGMIEKEKVILLKPQTYMNLSGNSVKEVVDFYKIEKEKQDNEISSARKSQVGSGDRSEKIRTYNYPQGRITDHRIGMSIYQMENFLNGDLDEMIDNLIAADRAEKLKGEED